MSTNSSQNTDNQEIDFADLTKKIGRSMNNLLTNVFKAILYFKKNIVVFIILFIIGVGIGFYLDKNRKIYSHQMIVHPNFGGVDYLYSKIDLISAKIKERDTIFLKNIGISQPKKFLKIEIKPVIDVYQFVGDKKENFEMIKLMAEDGDINKVLNDNVTSKNYPNHMISFVTDGETSHEETINPLLNYFNESDFYNKIKDEYLNNVEIKIVENDSIIGQINSLLNTFSSTSKDTQKSDKLVYYNENSQLNDVIETKEIIIKDQGRLRVELFAADKIVKDHGIITNIRDTEGVSGKMKLVLPFLFISFFIVTQGFRALYKKQVQKISEQQ